LLDDLDGPLPHAGKCAAEFFTGITAVGEDVAQPGEAVSDRGQNIDGAIAILNNPDRGEDEDQKSTRVRDDVALSAFHLLAGLIASNPAAFRDFDRLAIEDVGARGSYTAFDLARVHHQHRVDRAEQSSVAPSVEVALHCRYRREAFGKRTPGASDYREIQDRVDDFPYIGRTPPSATLGRRDEWCRHFPLVSHIRWMAQARSAMLTPGGIHGCSTL